MLSTKFKSTVNTFSRSLKTQPLLRSYAPGTTKINNTRIQYELPENVTDIKNYKDFIRQPVAVIKEQQNLEPKKFCITDSNDSKLLPLKLASHLYATVNIYTRPFTVQQGDVIILPSQLKDLKVGDVIDFSDVTVIGSTNYKIVDHPINPDIFEIKGRVVERSKSAEFVEERTTKRNRRVKHITKTVNMTMIEITDLRLK